MAFFWLQAGTYITQFSKIRKKVQFQKCKKALFAFSKMAKNQFLQPEKSLKLPKILFFPSKNCIFGNFKLFSGAKIDFMPFLRMQLMLFCTFEIALFSNFRALCTSSSRPSASLEIFLSAYIAIKNNK